MSIFEDEFMDAQANSVSLCLEFLDIAKTNVDSIYIYFYIEEKEFFFKSFFKKGNRIIYPENLSNRQGILEFLSCGADDAQNIQNVCKSYNKKCPCEMKLVFDTKTRKFDAEYRYEPIGYDNDPLSQFYNWSETIKEQRHS